MTPVYCLGLLVSVAGMIVIPYHLFKTRGVRGLIPILGLIGVLIAALFVEVLVYTLFSA
jgi:hypothetical protein